MLRQSCDSCLSESLLSVLSADDAEMNWRGHEVGVGNVESNYGEVRVFFVDIVLLINLSSVNKLCIAIYKFSVLFSAKTW